MATFKRRGEIASLGGIRLFKRIVGAARLVDQTVFSPFAPVDEPVVQVMRELDRKRKEMVE
jgi:hypothetical protein